MPKAPSTIAAQYAQALQDKFNAEAEAEFASSDRDFRWEYQFGVEAGGKYDRIWQMDRIGTPEEFESGARPFTGRSVHAFVVRETGELVKSGGWKAPQKDKNGLAVRYDLSTEFDYAVSVADKHGGYMYKGRGQTAALATEEA